MNYSKCLEIFWVKVFNWFFFTSVKHHYLLTLIRKIIRCFFYFNYSFFFFQIEEGDVIAVFERILPSALTSIITKEYALSALVKLDTRFSLTNEYVVLSPCTVFPTFLKFIWMWIFVFMIFSRIRSLVAANQTHHNLELQQRSAEFTRVLGQGELKLVLKLLILSFNLWIFAWFRFFFFFLPGMVSLKECQW